MSKITVDGCDYTFEEFPEGVIEVRDIHGRKIADCETDDATETLYYDFYTAEEGCLEEFSHSSVEMYSKSSREIAEWLVSTHPSNG